MLDIAQQKKIPPVVVCPNCGNEAVYQWGDSLHFEDGDYCVKCWNGFVKTHTHKMVDKPKQPEPEPAPAHKIVARASALEEENARLRADLKELIGLWKKENRA